MNKLKVGIIGCGTIGSSLAKTLVREFSRWVEVVALCDHTRSKALVLQQVLKAKAEVLPLNELIQKCDFILEAASAEISGKVAEKSLLLGKQVLIMSVGGLIGSKVFTKGFEIKGGRLWIPSGAVAGVDALLAASRGQIKQVRLVTRKPPEGLGSAPYFKKRAFPILKGEQEICVFRGNVTEAVKGFPQNINVSAVLSFAGIGARKTEVEIWTSRKYTVNQHEVLVEGDFGQIQTVTRNVPAEDNPKTSRLAILSAEAMIRKIFSLIRIGT
jgi:aspartate dehydrogenase